jgi:hypothetical protein
MALFLAGHMEPIEPLSLRRETQGYAQPDTLMYLPFPEFDNCAPGPEVHCIDPTAAQPELLGRTSEAPAAAFTMEITQTKMTLRGTLPATVNF